jgi:uncharacterized membrane-anchored protein YhcB (DUF1043 family)
VSGLTFFPGLFPRPTNPATPRLSVKTRVTEALKTVGITAPIGAVSGAAIAEGITHLPGQKIVGLNSVAKFFTDLFNNEEQILNINAHKNSIKSFLQGTLGATPYNIEFNLNALKAGVIGQLSKANDASLHLTPDQLSSLTKVVNDLNEDQIRALFADPTALLSQKLTLLNDLQSASKLRSLPFLHHLEDKNWLISHHIPVAGIGGLIGGLFTGLIGAGMSQRYAKEKFTAQTAINDLQQELDEQLRKKAAEKQLGKIEKLLEVVENEKDTLDNKRLLAELEAEVKRMTAELATTKGGVN